MNNRERHEYERARQERVAKNRAERYLELVDSLVGRYLSADHISEVVHRALSASQWSHDCIANALVDVERRGDCRSMKSILRGTARNMAGEAAAERMIADDKERDR